MEWATIHEQLPVCEATFKEGKDFIDKMLRSILLTCCLTPALRLHTVAPMVRKDPYRTSKSLLKPGVHSLHMKQTRKASVCPVAWSCRRERRQAWICLVELHLMCVCRYGSCTELTPTKKSTSANRTSSDQSDGFLVSMVSAPIMLPCLLQHSLYRFVYTYRAS